MATLLCIPMLLGLGYLFSEKHRLLQEEHKKVNQNEPMISPNEKPSAPNIYHNARTDEVHADEMYKASKNLQDAYDNDYLIKNYPESQWQRRRHKKIVQDEKDLIDDSQEQQSTRFPSSTLHEIAKTRNIRGFPLKRLWDHMTLNSYNDRRHNIPNLDFEEIGLSNGHKQEIVKSVLPKEKFQTNERGKKVRVFEKHNNMEPFIGSKITQNTNPDANRTLLEHFTGTQPVFKHKKPVKRFFPLIKDPFAVGGLPSSSNRETERYITAREWSNTIPFEQIRVAPGVAQPHPTKTNIGFHDPWRPSENGVFKDVNDLRVNPKMTYKGRIAGEGHYIPYGATKTAPTISRKPWKNLAFTNFGDLKTTGTGNIGKVKTTEEFTLPDNVENHIQSLREPLKISPEVTKPKDSTKETVILKGQQREFTGYKLGDFPTASKSSVMHNQTTFLDTAKTTIKQQTENAEHSHINQQDANQKIQLYYFDTAKETIRQQTQDNEHDMINLNDEKQGTLMRWWDKAKQTIRQQTQENPNSHINAKDENQKPQVYFFDTAKETIKQQTQDHVHDKINPTGLSKAFDITSFFNASINALKELAIAVNWTPVLSGVKVNAGKANIGEYDVFRKQQFETHKYSNKYDVTAPVNHGKELIGEQTQKYPFYEKDWVQQCQRTDEILTEQFRKNPYTQPLNSYIIPYNKAYPSIQFMAPITDPTKA